MSIDWPLATSSWDEDEITAIDGLFPQVILQWGQKF